MTLSACVYFPPGTNTHLAQLVVPPLTPNPVGNHYINKLLWTLITIIDVSVQWDVRLTICKLSLGGWVGGAHGAYHPSHNAGGRWRLGYHRAVGAQASLVGDGLLFRGCGCTVLDRLVGAPPKPFYCPGEESWLSLRWLFGLLLTSSQLCLTTRSVIINSLIIHLLYCCTNKTVIPPIWATIKDFSYALFFVFVRFCFYLYVCLAADLLGWLFSYLTFRSCISLKTQSINQPRN